MSVARVFRTSQAGPAGGGPHTSRPARTRLRVVAGLGAAVLTGGVIVATASPARAFAGTEYTVTSFDDNVAACGDPETTGMTLREAIDCANDNPGHDTVDFDPNIDDVQLIAQIPITDDVDILGTAGAGSLTVHGGDDGDGGLDRAFFINNPAARISVSISDMTIRDGDTSGNAEARGGAILDLGEDLSLTRVIARNNTATDDGGALFLDPEQGAALHVIDSLITSNTSESAGGGLAVSGSADTATAQIDISNTDIAQNTADYGGGLNLYRFSGYCADPESDPFSSGCSATAPAVTITSGSMVDSNIANNNGGGLWLRSTDVTLSGSTVSNNTASSGGGRFRGNGGGFFADGAANISVVSGSLIDANHAQNVFDPQANLDVFSNYPGGGGGIFSNGNVTLTDSTLSNNTASTSDGGGVYGDSPILFSTNTVFDSNSAGVDGGAAHLDDPRGDSNQAPTSFASSTFTDNTAGRNGGALSLFEDGNLNVPVTDSTFDGNGAGGDGGAIYGEGGASVPLTRSTVSNNTAVGDGGGLSGSMRGPVTDSTISGNTAGFGTGNGEGGGIFTGSTINIVQSTLSGNQTLSHDSLFQAEGGGLYADSFPFVSLSTIVNNDAISVGAGNTAVSGGDGIYSDNGGSVYGSIVALNGGASGEDLSTGTVVVEQPLFSVTYSLVQHPNAVIGGPGTGNILGVDPDLNTLFDNGGPTLTHLPKNTSPVIDAGDPGFEGPQQTDQRGAGFPRVAAITSATPRIDMGAVEVQALAVPSPSPTAVFVPPSPSPSPSANPEMRYVALTTPTRVLDTRNGTGAPAGLKTGDVTFDLSSVLPTNANGVVLNVTVTESDHNGHVLGFADGSPYPPTSNVNFVTGQTQANEAILKVPASRKVVLSIFGAHAHLVADVVGYFVPGDPSGANRVTTRTPTRFFDSRSTSAALRSGEITLDLSGLVPAGTTSAVLNLTATGANGGGFIVAYPGGTPKPGTSNVNYHRGSTQANEAFVRLGTGADAGKVTLFVDGSPASVIVDLVGTVDPGPGTATELGTPVRSLDTRNGTGGPTGRVFGDIDVTMPADVPANATGVILNVTEVAATGAGHFVVFATGSTVPATSSLNFIDGHAVANEVLTAIGPGKKVTVRVAGHSSHVVVDVMGYLTP